MLPSVVTSALRSCPSIGPDVVEAHLLEQGAGQHHALQVLLRAARQLPHGGHLAQHLLAALAQMRVHAAGQRARQVIGQRADVLRNRHVVVVQDDEQIRGRRARVVQRLEGHAGRERAVADDGHCATVLAALGGRDRHAERGGDGGAGMADAEGVVLALAARRERARGRLSCLMVCNSSRRPGEHLVRVGLMAHVPDQPVVRRIEDIVQRDGELDRAQARGEMAAASADALDQELPQLIGQRLSLDGGQPAQIRGDLDGLEQRIGVGWRDHCAQFILPGPSRAIDLRPLWHNRHAVAAMRGGPL